ncbi:MAG: T9SS type A sorting domain-containing protein [Bacteroidota bacterium]
MKKIILPALFSIFTLVSLAQPQLTSSNTNPAVGESFVHNTITYVSPGTSGANQTWNFSSVSSSGSTTTTFIAPGTTPYGGSFPTANLSVNAGGGNYAYYNGSSAAWQFLGAATSAATLSYSNAEDQLRYPTDYLDTYTDPFACNFFSGVNWYRTGNTTVTADGYGTIILPSGTYTNVMRVHLYQDYQDSSQFTTITYTNDQYLWYKPGNHMPIFSLFTLTTSTSGTSQSGNYMSSIALGEGEISPEMEMMLYPNPSNGMITVSSLAGENAASSIEVYTVTGQKVYSENVTQTTGTNFNMDLSFLPAGMYSLRVIFRDEKYMIKSFVIEK